MNRLRALPVSPGIVSALTAGSPVRSGVWSTPELRIVAVASGKGGVGKTNLAVNLALALADLRRQVLVVDGDFGLSKVDLLLGAEPSRNLSHVLDGECSLGGAIFTGPRGVGFLAGAFGHGELAVLNPPQRERLFHGLSGLAGAYDMVLLDLATGIGPNAVEFARWAGEVLIVTTPEPTAYADAYALMKVLARPGGEAPRVVVNRVRDLEEARDIFRRLSRTARKHLGVSPVFAGHVPEDPAVAAAVKNRRPFALGAPSCPANLRVQEMAWRLLQEAPVRSNSPALCAPSNPSLAQLGQGRFACGDARPQP